jgi:hypothetical protein
MQFAFTPSPRGRGLGRGLFAITQNPTLTLPLAREGTMRRKNLSQ